MSKQKVVIIGGVACGPKAAARIKRLNSNAEVTLIEKGALLSYAGCGLPFYISGEVQDFNELMATPVGVVRDSLFFKSVKDVNVYNKTIAENIDRSRKIVRAMRVETSEVIEIPYDKLVLGVGGTPIVPPLEGVDLKGVHPLSTIEDARQIRDGYGSLKGKNAVIVGGGLIGIEVVEAFVKQGMKATIVEKLDSLLGALIDPEIAYQVQNELKNKGIDLRLEDTVTKINGDENNFVKSVTTEKGEIPADLVLIAVGVRPNTSLINGSGIELGTTGAIKVDSHMRTSDPDIYAGGDCVENISVVSGNPIFTPMGSVANKHGRVIADNICGIDSEFKGVAGTAILKVFDINVARTGLSENEAKKEGYDFITILASGTDKPHFYPDAKLIIIKLVVDKQTRKLLGAQIVGPGDVSKRMDIAVTAIMSGATVDEISHYDLAYAPPFSSAMDNMIVAANIAQNILNGIGKSISPAKVKKKMLQNEDFLFLDVRSKKEFDEMRIEDPRVELIPLGMLRKKINELPKEKEIICFCKISLRGYEAQRILEAEGFNNVKFMDGGVVAWPYEKVVR